MKSTEKLTPLLPRILLCKNADNPHVYMETRTIQLASYLLSTYNYYAGRSKTWLDSCPNDVRMMIIEPRNSSVSSADPSSSRLLS